MAPRRCPERDAEHHPEHDAEHHPEHDAGHHPEHDAEHHLEHDAEHHLEHNVDEYSGGGIVTTETAGDDDPEPSPENVTLELSDPVDPESVSLDVVFDILSNSRRRLILSHLEEVGGESTTSDLAEYIAAIENDKPESELTSQERKRVYVGIYQTHLPKMENTAVVEVDDRGTVTLGPNADAIYELLESSATGDSSWPTYYGGHTVASAVAFVATWAVAQSFVPAIFALSLLVYATLVGLHVRSYRGG